MTKSKSLKLFWLRQTHPDFYTLRRALFDLGVGVVAPLLCLAWDPIVFGTDGHGFPVILRDEGFIFVFQDIGRLVVCYVAMGISMIALLIFLAVGRQLCRLGLLIVGVLLWGAVVAAMIGMMILPVSLIGVLFSGIGLLGFTPFVTAFVYLRASALLIQRLRGRFSRVSTITAVSLGFLASLATSGAVGWRVQHEFDRCLQTIARNENAPSAEKVMCRLYRLCSLTGRPNDILAWRYRETTDTGEKAALTQTYMRLTGRDISRYYLIR